MIAHYIQHSVPAHRFMISPESYRGVEGELWEERGGQDTSRTPKSSQSFSFALDFAGASVGGRAAQEQKARYLTISHGTLVQKLRKAARR
jgi:hypothetical protein